MPKKLCESGPWFVDLDQVNVVPLPPGYDCAELTALHQGGPSSGSVAVFVPPVQYGHQYVLTLDNRAAAYMGVQIGDMVVEITYRSRISLLWHEDTHVWIVTYQSNYCPQIVVPAQAGEAQVDVPEGCAKQVVSVMFGNPHTPDPDPDQPQHKKKGKGKQTMHLDLAQVPQNDLFLWVESRACGFKVQFRDFPPLGPGVAQLYYFLDGQWQQGYHQGGLPCT
jgi:hypothetical protein